MKSLPLSELRKKSNKWYKNYGVIDYDKSYTLKRLKYMAERSYEALPNRLKKYIEKDRVIETTAHSIIVDGEVGKWDMYESMLSQAETAYKMSGDKTAEFIFKQFRLQRPDVYAKYNSYVYRLGHSSAKWFVEHFDYDVKQYYLYATIELPIKTKGKIYTELNLTFRYDAYESGLLEIAEML